MCSIKQQKSHGRLLDLLLYNHNNSISNCDISNTLNNNNYYNYSITNNNNDNNNSINYTNNNGGNNTGNHNATNNYQGSKNKDFLNKSIFWNFFFINVKKKKI